MFTCMFCRSGRGSRSNLAIGERHEMVVLDGRYIRTHCVARGLRPLSIAAYRQPGAVPCLEPRSLASKTPDAVTARDVLEYLEHLRRERDNGDSAVNRAADDPAQLLSRDRRHGTSWIAAANPLAGFPLIKAVPRKLPVSLVQRKWRDCSQRPSPRHDHRASRSRVTRSSTAPASVHRSVPRCAKAKWTSRRCSHHRARQRRTRTHDSLQRRGRGGSAR